MGGRGRERSGTFARGEFGRDGALSRGKSKSGGAVGGTIFLDFSWQRLGGRSPLERARRRVGSSRAMARKRPRTEPPPRWSEPLLAPRSRPEIPGTGDAFRGVARPIERADAAEPTTRAAKPTTRTTTPKRFHLSSVRELHTGVGSAQDAGASVNYTRAPAWIQFEPDGDAVVAVAGGCPVARWDVRGNTVDLAALANDARAESSSSSSFSPDASPSSLLVSIREDTRGKSDGKHGTTFVSRARAGVPQRAGRAEARAMVSTLMTKKTFANGRARDDDVYRPKRNPLLKDVEDDLFTRKIDIGSAERYFSYYASLAEQQNMLQDRVRTGTYFTAILEHRAAFEGAIVMDVGAGSGVLSCFAALAGARRVYAVEASDMADHCARIVASDARLRNVVKVIKGRVESDATRREILEDLSLENLSKSQIPDSRVFDVLVSEPMGTMLLNERMIESFLIARDIFLKPEGGVMFPRAARMHCAPYEDAALRDEIKNKAAFWTRESAKDFYGVDVSVLGDAAIRAVFAQPVVDAFDPEILLAPPATFEFDFETRKKKETSDETSDETSETETETSGAYALAAEHLESLRLEADFVLHRGGAVHGVAWWFDVEFDVRQSGGEPGPHRRFLTTAPGAPTTHWFQIRAPIRDERGVLERIEKNTRLSVKTTMAAGSDQSYAVTSRLEVLKDFKTHREPDAALGSWNLKDPYYRQLHWPQPGYTEAQTERWYGDEAAEIHA